MSWENTLNEDKCDNLRVITNVRSVLANPRVKIAHYCGDLAEFTPKDDQYVKTWKASIEHLSKYIVADYIITDTPFDLTKSLFHYLDSQRILFTEEVNIGYPSAPLPDHRKWVRAINKLINAYGVHSLNLNCPERLLNYAKSIPGVKNDQINASDSRPIEVVLYEGATEVKPSKNNRTVLYSNMPECLDVYKLQRQGFSFEPSHAGLYVMTERKYALP